MALQAQTEAPVETNSPEPVQEETQAPAPEPVPEETQAPAPEPQDSADGFVHDHSSWWDSDNGEGKHISRTYADGCIDGLDGTWCYPWEY